MPGDSVLQPDSSDLLRCIETNTGLSPSRDPGRRDRRRNALKAGYISVRSREQPHWLEC